MSWVYPQVSVSLLLDGWCVTARGSDLQRLWPLVSHFRPWPALKVKAHFGFSPKCIQCNIFTLTVWYIWESNKTLSDPQMRRRALKLVLCFITLHSFPNTHPIFSLFLSDPSACAEMGRWSVCQRNKVTPSHSPLLSVFTLVHSNNKVPFQAVFPFAEIKILMSAVVTCFPWLAVAVNV